MKSREALKRLNQYWADNNVLGKSNIDINNNDFEAIYKDLEVLEIIKNKQVDIQWCRPHNYYESKLALNDNEIKLLKEWLNE